MRIALIYCLILFISLFVQTWANSDLNIQNELSNQSKKYDDLASVLKKSQLEASCASILECEKCYDTTGCHFCENDGRCHAIGSIYGCVWGYTCKTEDPCRRQTSEYIGVRYPSLFGGLAVIGGGLVGLLVLLCCNRIMFYGMPCCVDSTPSRGRGRGSRSLDGTGAWDTNQSSDMVYTHNPTSHNNTNNRGGSGGIHLNTMQNTGRSTNNSTIYSNNTNMTQKSQVSQKLEKPRENKPFSNQRPHRKNDIERGVNENHSINQVSGNDERLGERWL